jgi:hypothetical protein
MTEWAVSPGAHGLQRLTDLQGRRPHCCRQLLTGLGQCHAPRGALKERRSNSPLQCLDGLTDSRSRHTEVRSRYPEIAMLRHRQKCDEPSKLLDPRHHATPVIGQ